MNVFIILVSMFLTQITADLFRVGDKESELDMNFIQSVKSYGYPVLSYSFMTGDGYRVGLHRIPGSKGNKEMESVEGAGDKQPVICLHGIMGSAHDLTVAGPGKEGEDGKIYGKAYPF
jgi:hypothetical protein